MAAFIFFGALRAESAIQEEAVEYQHDSAVLEGFLAYDDSIAEKRPGILVISEWKGLNDYAKWRVRQLAELGYVAFAADMYGKGVRPQTHEEAAKLSGIYQNNRLLMRTRANAALQILQKHPLVDSEKLAAIGHCFGGTAVLELARGGYPLKGVVSFHGGF